MLRFVLLAVAVQYLVIDAAPAGKTATTVAAKPVAAPAKPPAAPVKPPVATTKAAVVAAKPVVPTKAPVLPVKAPAATTKPAAVQPAAAPAAKKIQSEPERPIVGDKPAVKSKVFKVPKCSGSSRPKRVPTTVAAATCTSISTDDDIFQMMDVIVKAKIAQYPNDPYKQCLFDEADYEKTQIAKYVDPEHFTPETKAANLPLCLWSGIEAVTATGYVDKQCTRLESTVLGLYLTKNWPKTAALPAGWKTCHTPAHWEIPKNYGTSTHVESKWDETGAFDDKARPKGKGTVENGKLQQMQFFQGLWGWASKSWAKHFKSQHLLAYFNAGGNYYGFLTGETFENLEFPQLQLLTAGQAIKEVEYYILDDTIQEKNKRALKYKCNPKDGKPTDATVAEFEEKVKAGIPKGAKFTCTNIKLDHATPNRVPVASG